MRHRHMTLDSAFSLVKSRRPFAWPNDNFWEQLQEEERRVFNKTLVTAVPANKTGTERHLDAQRRPPSAAATVQLLEGSLSHAQQQVLDEFLHDLQHFSAIHKVSAQAEICQDRVDVYGCALDPRQNSKYLSELEEILAFYSFEQVQWSSQMSTKALETSNVTRW